MRDVTSTILTDLKGNRSFSLHSCLGGNRASPWWEQSARSRPWTRVGLDADCAREVAGAAIRGDLTEIWLGPSHIVVMTTRSCSESRGQHDRARGGSCHFLVEDPPSERLDCADFLHSFGVLRRVGTGARALQNAEIRAKCDPGPGTPPAKEDRRVRVRRGGRIGWKRTMPRPAGNRRPGHLCGQSSVCAWMARLRDAFPLPGKSY